MTDLSVAKNAGHSSRGFKQVNLRAVVSIGALLVAWQALWSLGIIPARGFPSVPQTLTAFWHAFTEPFAGQPIWVHIGMSLLRWSIGVGAAVALGVLIGALMGWYPLFRALTKPLFEFYRYIPPLAWVPLTVLILGPTLKAAAFIVFVGALPPVVINTWSGVYHVDPIFADVAKTLGSGRLRTLFRVALPVSALSTMSGVRTAVAAGWASLIGAELVGAQSGLGFIIVNSEEAKRPADIIVGMVLIGVIGMLIDFSFRKISAASTRWLDAEL
ncbi:MAG: ABC transporter permease [Rhodoblastus sp.]|jgi:ABC-type nitrate/sulfonate/bicarbonate transport system permease component